MTLRDEDLQEMGITSRKDREKLLSVIARLSTKSEVHNCGDFQFHSAYSMEIIMGGLGTDVGLYFNDVHSYSCRLLMVAHIQRPNLVWLYVPRPSHLLLIVLT